MFLQNLQTLFKQGIQTKVFIYFRWYIHKQNCILIFQTKKIEFLVKLLRCSVAICKFTKWILYKVKTFKELQNAIIKVKEILNIHWSFVMLILRGLQGFSPMLLPLYKSFKQSGHSRKKLKLLVNYSVTSLSKGWLLSFQSV